MKRSGPIQRKTPMRATRKRASVGLKRPPMDKDVRNAVFDRAEGMCDLCGCNLTREDGHAHHRKLRSRGGDDSLGNLVSLCALCHSVVHLKPKEATELGFMVPSWEDPATSPVHRHRRTWALPGVAWGDVETEGAKDDGSSACTGNRSSDLEGSRG